MGIKHKATKAARDKGLASEWNDDHKIDGNVDFEKHQALNVVIENRTDFPAGPVEGQIVCRTDLDAVYVYDGTNWSILSRRVNYWSLPGSAFSSSEPATDDVYVDYDNGVIFPNSGTNLVFGCFVTLPHGAIVTAVKVNGIGTWNWWMYRDDLLATGFPTEMATGTSNSEDTTITNATIDNSLYRYWIETYSMDVNDEVDSVRITYII